MDDFNLNSLRESKNEWCSRLLNVMVPLITEGLKSIFDDSCKICKENKENAKYLMTFQNFLSRVPKWNGNMIESERKRMIEKSGCTYLEDLITCVHIVQLKMLSTMRTGSKQKKIDIAIPKIDDFIHKVYIHTARKVYKNVYLFENNISPLQVQRYQRDLEHLICECILNAVRESIPVENILRAYMDETVEYDISEEIKETLVPAKKRRKDKKEKDDKGEKSEKEQETNQGVKFSDNDYVRNDQNQDAEVFAPKTIERLEEISVEREKKKKDDETDDDDGLRLRIIDSETVSIENDIQSLDIGLDSGIGGGIGGVGGGIDGVGDDISLDFEIL